MTSTTLNQSLPDDEIVSYIMKDILKISFKYELYPFGGVVRSYLRNETPNDLDISYHEKEEVYTFIADLKQHYIVDKKEQTYQTKKCLSYEVTSKNFLDRPIKVDLVPFSNVGKDQDFDVNAFYMTNEQSILIAPNHPEIDMFGTINNIQKKRFSILKKLGNQPVRKPGSIVESSKYIIANLKIQSRVAKMLSNGWTCIDVARYGYRGRNPVGGLNKMFNPFYITENSHKDTCFLCKGVNPNRYVMAAPCCHKEMCFECIQKYVKENFHTEKLICPACSHDF